MAKRLEQRGARAARRPTERRSRGAALAGFVAEAAARELLARRRGRGRRRGGDEARAARVAAASPAALAALGFVGGLAVGATVWSQMLDRSRQGLFSAHPVRRFAAVSYLGGRPSVDTVRLLRDYIQWETHPLLRRRARRVLRAVEASLAR
jgi:hypothetical protein